MRHRLEGIFIEPVQGRLHITQVRENRGVDGYHRAIRPWPESPLQSQLVVGPGPPEPNPIAQIFSLQPVGRYSNILRLAYFLTIDYLNRDDKG